VLDLNALGIKNTAALLGGWLAWKETKLPTETGAKKPIQTPKPK
jgi:3-mercaptopyruvate sulfurtransferase SseA